MGGDRRGRRPVEEACWPATSAPAVSMAAGEETGGGGLPAGELRPGRLHGRRGTRPAEEACRFARGRGLRGATGSERRMQGAASG
jgi:hypothetical protein